MSVPLFSSVTSTVDGVGVPGRVQSFRPNLLDLCCGGGLLQVGLAVAVTLFGVPACTVALVLQLKPRPLASSLDGTQSRGKPGPAEAGMSCLYQDHTSSAFSPALGPGIEVSG
jgi:hypothetical protein